MTNSLAALFVTLAVVAPLAAAGEAPRPKARPRLFFAAREIAALKAKCAGPMQAQFDAVTKYAAEHLADAPPAKLEGDNEEKGLKIEHPFLTNILDFSFLYLVTDDPKYLAAAKRWTLGLARLEEWEGKVVQECKEGDRGLYTGFGLTALAAAYDWLYNEFTPAERRVIRAKIASRCEAIYRATFPEDVEKGGEWWGGAYLHHDHTIPVAGMGLGALAIMDEAPEARVWAARAEEEFLEATKRLGVDGGWHEGPCGWAFAMASFVPFWDAYSRAFPTRLDDSTWLQETWRFRLYSRTPDGKFISFGDGRDTGNYQWTAYEAAPALRFIANRFGNPYAQWPAEQEWQARPNPYTAVWEIIWADTSLAPAPPDGLPQSALFENEGLAVMRTGWGATDTVVGFHCDSLVGAAAAEYHEKGDDYMNTAVDHTHADANSLAIWSRGGFALRNAGYGQRDTGFQNSVLVDGGGQYRSFDRKARPATPRGVVKRFFTSKFASFVEGEAAGCYPPGLDRFTRQVFLVSPGMVFVADRLSAEKEFLPEWVYHVEKAGKIETEPFGFTADTERLRTVVHVTGVDPLKASTADDKWNTGVRLTPPKKAADWNLIAAVVPSLPSEKVSVAGLTASSLAAARGAVTAVAAFSRDGNKFDAGDRITGSGAAAIAVIDGGTRGFVAVDATALSVDGMQVLSAPVPVTVSCVGSAAGGEVTIEAKEPTQVAIDPGFPVGLVTLADGKKVPYLADGPRIILNVPEGAFTYRLVPGEPSGIPGN